MSTEERPRRSTRSSASSKAEEDGDYGGGEEGLRRSSRAARRASSSGRRSYYEGSSDEDEEAMEVDEGVGTAKTKKKRNLRVDEDYEGGEDGEGEALGRGKRKRTTRLQDFVVQSDGEEEGQEEEEEEEEEEDDYEEEEEEEADDEEEEENADTEDGGSDVPRTRLRRKRTGFSDEEEPGSGSAKKKPKKKIEGIDDDDEDEVVLDDVSLQPNTKASKDTKGKVIEKIIKERTAPAPSVAAAPAPAPAPSTAASTEATEAGTAATEQGTEGASTATVAETVAAATPTPVTDTPTTTASATSAAEGKEYLIKWKGISYLHTEWLPQSEIEQFENGPAKIKRFYEKREALNPQWSEVERVIGEKKYYGKTLYLVKFRGLAYDECYWEEASDAIAPAVASYRARVHMFAKPKVKRQPNQFNAQVQPPKFKGDRALKDYQLEGFRWLVFCWFNKRGSILADEMGLGKTIQSISVLYYLYKNVGIPGPFLIIAPLSTITHWQREIENWTDMYSVLYHGTQDARSIMNRYEIKPQYKGGQAGYKFNILLTTYEMVAKGNLSSIEWQYLIVDEGHRIKSSSSKLLSILKKYKTQHKLLLTGTPIQNEIGEMWTLLNYLDPKHFNSLPAFLEDYGDLKNQEQVEQLHKLLDPYLLRRMKEDVDKTIPCKEETIIEIELTKFQKTYYRALLEKNRHFLSMGVKTKTNIPNLMNIFMEIRKLCNHPFLIKGVEESYMSSKTQTDKENGLTNTSAKLVLLDKLLPKLKEGNHKVLIFSQMVRMLDILEDYLIAKNEYSYVRLDGNVKTQERQLAIDRFATDPNCFIFLLSTRAGGVGINLTAADTVVIYDSDWNPQNDLQAQARCHRIGQTNNVQVYRLVTRNTYERTMLEIASKKLAVDHVVLSKMGDDNEINKLDPKELDRLLKFGAYEAFAEEKEDDYSEDIEHILARSEKLQYATPSTNSGLSSFSKAKFISNDDASVVEIDDENFWEKILPEYTSVRKLTAVLKDKSAFASPESRAKFFKDLLSLVNEAQRDEEATFRHEVIEFLRTIRNVSEFTEEEKANVENWTAILEGPRLRSRKTKHKITQDEDEDDKVSDDRDYQQVDEEDDSEDDEIEADDAFRAPVEKSAFGKTQIPHSYTSVIKPQKQSQQQQQVIPKAEWTKPARDRFKSALLQYGYGRWNEIVTAAGLKSKGVVSVQSFAECFLQIILLSMNDETYHDLYKQLIGATTKIDFVLPPEGTGDLEVSVRQTKFCPSDTIELIIKKSGAMAQTEETCTVILEYHATEKQSHCVRGITFKSVTDLEQVRIIAPGLMGTYSINVFIPGFKSAKTKIEVVCHPIFINDPEFKELIEKSGKNWAQRLQFLWGIKLITDRYGPELSEMPDLGTGRYIPAWYIPGKVLLAGIYKYGYGKFKDIFMREGSSFESFIANLETPIKLQTNALQRRAETLINEFFKLLRNEELSRRSTEQVEATEKQPSPQPEQKTVEINADDLITVRVKGQDNTHIVFSNQLRNHNLAFIINTYWEIMNKKGELRDMSLNYNGKVVTPTTTPLDLGMTEGSFFVINATWATNQPEIIMEELQLNRQTRYLYDYNRFAGRLIKDYEARYPPTNDESIKYIFNDKVIPLDVTLADFGLTYTNNVIKVNRTIAFSFKHVEMGEVSNYEIPLETTIYVAVENYCELKSLSMEPIQILYQTPNSTPSFLSKEQAKRTKVTAKCCIILAPKKLVIKVAGPVGEPVSFRVSTSMALEKLFQEYCNRTSQDIKSLRFEDDKGRKLLGGYTLLELDFKECTIQAKLNSESPKSPPKEKPKPVKKEICVVMNKHTTRFLVGGNITLENLRKHFCSRNGLELRNSLRFKYQNKLWPITCTLDELNVRDSDFLELVDIA